MDFLPRSAAFAGFILGLFALLALPSCKQEVPAHWMEMNVPLGAGELRAGEDHTDQKIVIEHGGIADTSGTCENYTDHLIEKGFRRGTDSADQNSDEQIIRTFDKEERELRLICRNGVDKTVVTLEYQ